jgi:hypothetical protein
MGSDEGEASLPVDWRKMPKAVPVVELTQDQVTTIQIWNEANETLTTAKANELSNRLLVIKTLPFDTDKEEGGQSLKLNAGWKLVCDKPMNYTVDKDVQKIMACMNELAAVNPGAAAELIRWEAVISTGAYKKLTENERLIIAPIVTMKPGTPSLKLQPPKESK